MNRRLQSALKQQKKQTEQTKLQILGTLGIPLGGSRLVEVPNRNSFVYVQLRSNQNEVIQAFNNKVAPSYGLPVMVQRESTRYVVMGVDTQRYQNNWNSFAPYLPRHGNTHSFDTESGGGGDIAWIYSKQFMPLLSIPSGSNGGPNVIVSPHVLESVSGTWMYVGNTGTPSLLNYLPTGSNAVMALVYLDRLSGNPYLIINSGSYFANNLTGTAQIVPYIPTVQNPYTHIPLGAIRLVTGTTHIGWENIYDVRQFLQYISSGTVTGGGGGSSVDTIGFAGLYNGSPIGTGTFLNVRSNVALFTKSGSMFDLFITGSTSPQSVDTIGFAGLYNGTPIGTGTFMNVRGDNVLFTKSGSMFDLFVTGTPRGVDQIGAFILDEGVPLGTGTWLNFVGDNVSVTLSGTVARIFVTGSIGGGQGSTFTGIPVYKDGTFVATGTSIDFEENLYVGATGTTIFVRSPITTYFRVGQPTSLGGGFYRVPDGVYASGSLGVFLDGSVRVPVIDYQEQLWVSGTYRLYATGTTQVVHYGVPCSPQIQPTTGSAGGAYDLVDSDSELLTDSDGIQLTDSEG